MKWRFARRDLDERRRFLSRGESSQRSSRGPFCRFRCLTKPSRISPNGRAYCPERAKKSPCAPITVTVIVTVTSWHGRKHTIRNRCSPDGWTGVSLQRRVHHFRPIGDEREHQPQLRSAHPCQIIQSRPGANDHRQSRLLPPCP